MTDRQAKRGRAFKELHLGEGVFVMPNAWNAGSAAMLEAAKFPAIGTTSAGIAFSAGLPDYDGCLLRDDALSESRQIAEAVSVPVSIDGENGYGHDPKAVAESIRLFAETGAVGASIEDFGAGFGTGNLYDREHAVERIQAAAQAARALDFDFTLTARTECYLQSHDNAFEESVIRANLYRQAGADCLYVPGVKDVETIGALVREIDGPLNVVMGLLGDPISVNELEDLGVKRISVGGSIARATFGLIRRAAEEIREQGTFHYAKEQVPDSELCEFFASRLTPKSR